MEIYGKTGAGSISPPSTTPKPKPAARLVTGDVNFERSMKLTAALDAVPESRVEKIARLAAEVGQPSYPPREMLIQIAGLLAMKLSPDGGDKSQL
jgi:hypothetical protein